MMTATFRECAECRKPLSDKGVKLYGNGDARCYPKCVRKYERRLNKTRGKGGRFGRRS